MDSSDEITIITDIKDGNHESYRLLVERYHRGLIQHLYNLTKDQAVAEDLAQEAFLRAYSKISLYNPKYAFSTWLYKIADNLAYRQLKQNVNFKDIDEIAEVLPDDRPTPLEDAEKTFAAEQVRGAVNGLPLNYRQVIGMYYWDNFSYEEISTIIDCPVGTVRTWLFRAKEQLRKDLYGRV